MSQAIDINKVLYEERNPEDFSYKSSPGITEEIVRQISKDKNEPDWMLQKRLEALKEFNRLHMPRFGPSLKDLDLNNITLFAKPNAKQNARSWEEVPKDIKRTFERLGIPEAERKYFAGAGTQYESLNVYHNLKKEWEDKGVVFLDMDEAVQKYPELVKEYFMTKCVPISLHKFSALHAAVFSGGTFIYVPKNVKVDMPLQAYFRMNSKKMGQFEHTLIIVDEGAEVTYIEACFTKGNLVTSNPDYVKIEDIKPGMKVLTHDGTYKKVKEIFKMPYKGKIAKIKLYGNSVDEIDSTEGHPFLYIDRISKRDRNKEWNIRWNIPRYFKKGDYLALPINKTIISRDFHEVEIKEWNRKTRSYDKVKKKIPSTKGFFKLVGYYLAEGSISDGHYLNFSFGSKEKHLIEDVKGLLKKIFGVTTLEFHHKKNNGTSIVVCSTELCRIFEMFGKKANLKHIPQWMLLEDPKKQQYLIEGYFRGDGNYYKKRHKYGLKEVFRLDSVSETLMRQCRDILLRLGVVSFLNVSRKKRENRQPIYTLGVAGEYMAKFGNMVGIKVDSKLNYKDRASMFGIKDNFVFLPIKEINFREVENETVYNFSVENNETYCVAGAVAHNCSAPVYSENSLHAGCVEIIVKKDARARYYSVENWSKNTYNLNTKRAYVEENGVIEWINSNFGSKVTMLYPCSLLVGKNSKADFLGIAFATKNQHQDTGTKVYHIGENTSSTSVSKSISKDGGITTYRGLINVGRNAKNSKVNVQCDAMMTDNISKSETIPLMNIGNKNVSIEHEASVSKISEDKLFYLMSRGINEEQARQMIVSGFIEPIIKKLPVEYAVEMNRLVELEMEGSLG